MPSGISVGVAVGIGFCLQTDQLQQKVARKGVAKKPDAADFEKQVLGLGISSVLREAL